MVGQNDSRAVYIVSSESFEPKRFVPCWTKVERKDLHPISSTVTTRTSVLLTEMDENEAKYWYPNEKMVVVRVCLNGRCCSSGCMGIVSYYQR